MTGRVARRKALNRYLRRAVRSGRVYDTIPPCLYRFAEREDRRVAYAYDMRSERPIMNARTWYRLDMDAKMRAAMAEGAAWWAEMNGAGLWDDPVTVAKYGTPDDTDDHEYDDVVRVRMVTVEESEDEAW